jgi:hypothetical protein
MRFIDNWCYALTDELLAGGTELPVAGEAIARLALAEGDEYVLCIVGELDPLNNSGLEVVRLVGLASGYELLRGEQGTTDVTWPAGAVVHCGVTAALLAELWAAAQGGGGGSDDTVIEHITDNVHTRFFGTPSTPPSRLGQVCRQIEINGLVCEWVAYVLWDDSLQWRRSVLPMADWGLGIADSFTTSLLDSDRAFAMTTDAFAENPVETTLALPPAVAAGDGIRIPIVIANWSAQTWTLVLDPAAFWQSGAELILQTSAFDALGITSSSTELGVVSCVVPANTRVWFDLTAVYSTDETGPGMFCEITARPINLYLN